MLNMFICSTRLEASIYDAWSYFRCGDEIGYLVGATTLIIYHILIHIGQMLHKSECLKVSINNDNCKHAVSYSLIVLRHKLYYYGTYVHNNMYKKSFQYAARDYIWILNFMYVLEGINIQHLLAISLVNGGIWAFSKLFQFNVGIWFPKWWITLEKETKEKI